MSEHPERYRLTEISDFYRAKEEELGVFHKIFYRNPGIASEKPIPFKEFLASEDGQKILHFFHPYSLKRILNYPLAHRERERDALMKIHFDMVEPVRKERMENMIQKFESLSCSSQDEDEAIDLTTEEGIDQYERLYAEQEDSVVAQRKQRTSTADPEEIPSYEVFLRVCSSLYEQVLVSNRPPSPPPLAVTRLSTLPRQPAPPVLRSVHPHTANMPVGASFVSGDSLSDSLLSVDAATVQASLKAARVPPVFIKYILQQLNKTHSICDSDEKLLQRFLSKEDDLKEEEIADDISPEEDGSQEEDSQEEDSQEEDSQEEDSQEENSMNSSDESFGEKLTPAHRVTLDLSRRMTRSQTRKGSTPTSTPPTVPGLTSRTRRSGNRSPREPPRSPPPRQSPVVLPVLVDRTPRKRRAKDACAVERRPADSTTPDVPPGKNAAESEDGVSENVPSNDVVSSTREEDSGIVMLGATLNGTASSDEDPVGEWRGIPVTKNVSPTSGIALKKFIIAELGSSTVTSSLSVKLSRLESSVIETWTKKTTEEVSGNFGSQEMGDTAPASHSGNNPRRRTRWQCADQQTLPSPADPLTEDGDLPFPVPPSSPVGVEEYAPFVFRAGPNSPGGDDCLFDDDIPKLQSRSRSFRLPLRTGVSFSPITLLRSPMVDGSRLPDSMAVSRSLSQLNLSASDLSLTRPLSKSCLSLARPEGFCEAGSSESGSVWESVKRRLFFKRILKWFGHGESK